MDIKSEFHSKLPPLCGNCYQPTQDKVRTTLTIQGSEISEYEVQIIDAIEYIYGISWNEFLKSGIYLKIVKRKTVPNEEVLMDMSVINLCDLCALLLSANYAAHKEFEKFSHPSSLVRWINSFRVQQNLHEENDCDDCNPPSDHCDDELIESFNFDRELDNDDLIEEKYHVSDEVDEVLQQNSASVPKEKCISSKTSKTVEPLLSKYSLRSQLVVKLKRLSSTKDVDLISKKNKHLPGTEKTPFTIRIRKSSQEKVKKAANADENKFRGRVKKLEFSGSEVRKPEGKGYKQYKVKCQVCGLKLDYYYYRKKHLPRHFGKGVRGPQCQICGKILSSPNGFIYHMNVTHADEDEKRKLKSPCEICGALMYANSLKLHMNRHSGSREIFKCDKCDKEYLTKQIFNDHMLTHSEQFTPHLCVQCGKTFSSKSSLREHEKLHAATEKKFGCDICSLKFHHRSALNTHLQSHSKERKFVCDECGKSFKFQAHLAMHLKIHKEIKEKGNVKCDDCGKFFKHSLSLYKHRTKFHRTDLKKTIYKCSFCDKILCSQTNLTIHENLHKNNPGYKPRKKQTWKHKDQL